MLSRGSTSVPPVGKSGPGIISSSVSVRAFGRTDQVQQCFADLALHYVAEMLVAMPTAMPEEPLASRLGNAAGRTSGSSFVPS